MRSQTLVADGPLARVYLIAQAARYPLDLETDIQKPLLGERPAGIVVPVREATSAAVL